MALEIREVSFSGAHTAMNDFPLTGSEVSFSGAHTAMNDFPPDGELEEARPPRLPWKQTYHGLAPAIISALSYVIGMMCDIGGYKLTMHFWTDSPSTYWSENYYQSVVFMTMVIVNLVLAARARHPLYTDSGLFHRLNCFVLSLVSVACSFLFVAVLITNKRNIYVHVIFAVIFLSLMTTYMGVYVILTWRDFRKGVIPASRPASIILAMTTLCFSITFICGVGYFGCYLLLSLKVLKDWTLPLGGGYSFDFDAFEWMLLFQFPVFIVCTALWSALVAPPQTHECMLQGRGGNV